MGFVFFGLITGFANLKLRNVTSNSTEPRALDAKHKTRTMSPNSPDSPSLCKTYIGSVVIRSQYHCHKKWFFEAVAFSAVQVNP